MRTPGANGVAMAELQGRQLNAVAKREGRGPRGFKGPHIGITDPFGPVRKKSSAFRDLNFRVFV
jgi:hypothetical protein